MEAAVLVQVVTVTALSRLTSAMNAPWFILITSLTYCMGEWVLLPRVSEQVKKQSTMQGFCPQKSRSARKDELCPDFHNLTVMSYGSTQMKDSQGQNGWEISLEDASELLRQNEQLPKTREGMFEMVKKMGEKLEMEAEKQLRNLFASGSREARTKYIGFPSMESSLMTVSMLLFGVYLTKIILKLLQGQYSRYNMNIGMMGGIRAPLTVTKGRRARSIDEELEKINLMHLIDKYQI